MNLTPSLCTGMLLLSLSACGGRAPIDYSQYLQSSAHTASPLDLAAQNRLSLQWGTGSGYLYTQPSAEAEALDSRPELPLASEPAAEAMTTVPAASPALRAVSRDLPLAKPSPPALPSQAATPSYPQAPNFSLESLQGQSQDFRFPSAKARILAFADQKGSEQMEAWITPLYARYTERVEIHGIAELSGVPGFARGMVRGIISGLVEQPVMLDWNGSVSKQFGVQKGVTNLFVLNPQGQILLVQRGQADLDKLKAIVAVLDPLLN